MPTRNLGDAEKRLETKFRQSLFEYSRTWISKRFEVRIAEVLRTDDEQKALWWWSRYEDAGVVKQKIVNGERVAHLTYCDGVIDKSRHQPNARGKSEAVDFFIVKRSTGKADWAARVAFHVFGRICEKQGLKWGGRFPGFRDLGHVELPR